MTQTHATEETVPYAWQEFDAETRRRVGAWFAEVAAASGDPDTTRHAKWAAGVFAGYEFDGDESDATEGPAAIVAAVGAVEPRIHIRQDGVCWPDCPGCLIKAALVTGQVPFCEPCAMGDSCRQHDPREPKP